MVGKLAPQKSQSDCMKERDRRTQLQLYNRVDVIQIFAENCINLSYITTEKTHISQKKLNLLRGETIDRQLK